MLKMILLLLAFIFSIVLASASPFFKYTLLGIAALLSWLVFIIMIACVVKMVRMNREEQEVYRRSREKSKRQI